MTMQHAPQMTSQQFTAAFALVYVAAGLVVLLIWAGIGFAG